MSRETIAKALKRLRERSGLTADQVGAIVGKSGKTVNAWENNHGQPDAEMLMMLCDIYNVSDILAEFREGVSELPFAASEHEKNIILAYRNHPDMQHAVDVLLEIPSECEEDNRLIYRAARSIDNHEATIERRSARDLEKFESAPTVNSDDDL